MGTLVTHGQKTNRIMPLVVLCGVPSSGKTTVVAALRSHLRSQLPGEEVVCISPASVNVDETQGYVGTLEMGGGRCSSWLTALP
jgi:adenylate kinase